MDARRVGRVALRTVVALTSAAALVATGLVWNLQQRLQVGAISSDAVPNAAPTPVGEEFTALLVGLDARTDAAGNPLPPELLAELHAGPDEGQLHTDTIMLLHVPAGDGAGAVAISIPRDSFVPIAGDRGTHKINSAYRRGMDDAAEALAAQGITGPELDRRGREAGRATLVATVQQLTGVAVDHFAEINLAGFVELTQALGGVPVCLNEPVRDSYSGVDLPAGPQTLGGAEALAFVRQRHGLDGGDLDRIARQQAFAAGLAQRLTDAGTLADPRRLDRLVDIATRHVVLDRGWSVRQLPGQLRRLAGDALVFHTIPTGRTDLATPVDGVAVQIDPQAVRDFVHARVAEATPATPRSVGGGSYVGSDVEGPPVPATPAAPPSAEAPTAPTASAAPGPTPPGPPITADGTTCVN